MSEENTPGTMPEDTQGSPEAAIAAADAKAATKGADDGKDGKDTPDPNAVKDTPDKAEDTPDPDSTLTEDDIYVDHGHPEVNAALDMLKEAGVSAKEVATWFQAVMTTGDLSKVDVKAMTDRVGASKANLVMSAVKSWYNDEIAAQQAIRDEVDRVCGGKENFEVIREWARARRAQDEAFDKKMSDFEQLFDMGPHTAKLAAQELYQMYNDDPRNRSLATRMEHGDSRSSDNGSAPRSRAEYLERVKEADRKGDKHEVARLNAQWLQIIRNN